MEPAPAPPNAEPSAEPKSTSWVSVLVVLLIVAGVALTAYFGVRVLRSARQLRHMRLQPGVTDVALIRPWMTIPYIARAYRVPEAVLWQGLGIPEQGSRHKSLRVLDREYANGQPGVILSKVQYLIQSYQAQHPTAFPPPTRTP